MRGSHSAHTKWTHLPSLVRFNAPSLTGHAMHRTLLVFSSSASSSCGRSFFR